MDDDGRRRWLVLRAAVAALSSLVAAGAAVRLELRPLDVALYAVLTPIAVLTLLTPLPLADGATRSRAPGAARPSVVPEPDASSSSAVEPSLTGPALALARARERVVQAGAADADLQEVLALSAALHDAALELARATLARGGEVPQELRDEIALQDRAEQGEPTAPAV